MSSKACLPDQKKHLVWVVFAIFLITSACGTVTPPSSPATAERIAVELTHQKALGTSTADQFNQSLFSVPIRELTHSPDYPIGPQDKIEVNLFNVGPSDGLPNKMHVRVGNNGIISLPLLGQVEVAGLTRTELEQKLHERYSEFMHDPDVGVSLAENRSRSVYVLGSVKNPGVYAVTGQERLRRVLAMAGGLSADAGMFVHVSRETTQGEQAYVIGLGELANDKTGNLDVAVRPGDFINVPRAGSFYVDGHVARPNAYPLSGPYTLTQAITLAGGLSEYASSSGVTVFRQGKEEAEVLTRDLAKIRSGEEDDLKLVENDVVIVPPSTGRVVLSTILGMVGITTRGASSTFTFGRTYRALPLTVP